MTLDAIIAICIGLAGYWLGYILGAWEVISRAKR
jgi:hypothetical protein